MSLLRLRRGSRQLLRHSSLCCEGKGVVVPFAVPRDALTVDQDCDMGKGHENHHTHRLSLASEFDWIILR
jgi:hypothetical protein